jgi:citrate lyase subunit beta/citryl-CoA lyase
MMTKAADLRADEIIFDLEDACAPNEKVGARALVIEALQTLDFGTKACAVRVNAVGSRWSYGDIIELVSRAAPRLGTIVVPKIESASQVHFVDHLLDAIEKDLDGVRVGLELLIESPRGAVSLREIVRASARIESIVFGPGDYAASLGVGGLEIGTADQRYRGHQWNWVMSELANHARAADAHAIDGPSADFSDEDEFRVAAMQARLLGFDGKWCIHPNQIPWANEVFTPTEAEIREALEIVAAYAQAVAEGTGAISLDGKLVDEATRKLAESTIERAEAAGLVAREQ